jgi:hypothetical protein
VPGDAGHGWIFLPGVMHGGSKATLEYLTTTKIGEKGQADYWKVDARGRALLLPLLNGLNIAIDLIQVRKVVTCQQSQHHLQGLRAALIVLAAAP